ncbi:MAG: MurR/RpiR family transcriptional regulator [Bulleidia sp.]
MENILTRIELYRAEYTKTDHNIADFLTAHPHDVATHTMAEISQQVGISKSALVRFSQKIGLEGYSALKFEISRYLVSRNASHHDMNRTPIQVITSAYSDYIQKIAEMITMEETVELSKMILKARRIKILGTNRSYHAAQQLKRRLSRIGIDSEALYDASDIEDASCICDENDLFIIFSISGQGNYDEAVREMYIRSCPVICITMSRVLSFAKKCTRLVYLPRIDKDSDTYYLDNQAIFLVYIEILLNVLVTSLQ